MFAWENVSDGKRTWSVHNEPAESESIPGLAAEFESTTTSGQTIAANQQIAYHARKNCKSKWNVQ